MNSSRCILCNNNRFTKLFTKNRWDIVRCDACDFVFVDPLPSESQIEEFYNKHSEPLEQRIAEYLKHYRSRARRNKRKIKLLEKIQKQKGRILDIGCGLGLFVKSASEMDWEAYGVDIDKDMIEYGKRTFDAHLICAPLNKAGFPDEYFDAITMLNLLDHIREPLIFLKEVERILKPHGVIYLNVHDVEGWKAKRYRENWGAYCPLGHLYYYSHKTLQALLDKVGLRFYMVPGVNLKEGIKMLIVKRDDPRKKGCIRDKFEKFIFNIVQTLKL